MASSAADDSDASSPVVAQTLPHLTQFLDKKALCVFTGTIKCVPEDFVVTEIALNGGVVSLAVPPPLPPPVALAATESARSNGAGDGAGGGAGAQSTPAPAPTPTPAPPPSSADCTPQVKACLALGDARKALQLLGVDITPDVDVRLEHVRTAAASTPVDLIVPAACLESRNTRAALHQAVQLAFPGVTTRVDAGPPPALRVEHDARFDPLRPLLHSTDLVALQRYAVRGPQHEAARRGVSMVNSQLGKDERRKVHQALARSLRGLTSATRPHQEGKPQPRATKRQRRESTAAATVTTAETVIVVRYKPGKPSKRRQKQQKQQKQQTGGQATSYTWFALQKTGIEQQVALGQLSRAIAAELGKRARINPSSFSFAGIKDKVGVTTQQCCVPGVAPAVLKGAAARLQNISVGACAMYGAAIRTGALRGNKFCIAVRNLRAKAHAGCSSIEEAWKKLAASIATVARQGFVNYYGHQRVGLAREHATAARIGLGMIMGKWQACTSMLLAPADGDSAALRTHHQAKQAWKESGDPDAAAKSLPSNATMPRLVLKALGRYGSTAHATAWRTTPYTMRTFCVHAWQSCLWNQAASARLQAGGAVVAAGDLVVTASDGAPLPRTAPPHVRSEAAHQGCVRLVTSVDVAASSFDLGDVVLPLPGRSVLYPGAGAALEVYRTALAAIGLTLQLAEVATTTAAAPHRAKMPGGSYRLLVSKPWGVAAWRAPNGDSGGSSVVQLVPPPVAAVDLPSTVKAQAAAAVAVDQQVGRCDCDDTNSSSSRSSRSSRSSAGSVTAMEGSCILEFSLAAGCYATMCIRQVLRGCAAEASFASQGDCTAADE